MKEQFFKVTLKSDVVLNSKLATEGNMETLDYIPGSNFLGIVASQLYNKISTEDAYELFHSGKVSFGDALISKNDELSYSVPFDYMMVKGEDKLSEHQVYLQHLLTEDNHPKDENDYKLQLKQQRAGFITPSGKAITKIEKTFALKSAQDATTRRSKEAAMFGFESLQAGQEFIFSVQSEDENLLNQVVEALKGNKRIGKSKTAQYGQVKIEVLKEKPKRIETFENEAYTLVYVQSNLCVIDTLTGQPTLQPTAENLKLQGEVDWSKSLVRSYSYSPWNGKRNTNDTLRTCIGAGSVLYLKAKNNAGEKSVGAYQAEGLGRIIVNPVFLQGNKEAECDFVEIKPKKDEKTENNEVYYLIENPNSLNDFLNNKAFYRQEDIKLSQAIQEELNNASSNLKQISNSQWGAIRNYATKAKDWEQLKNWLFERKEDEDNPNKTVGVGYLEHGVAYDRYWIKNKKEFKEVFGRAEKFGPIFIVKFAAQMAK